ncbi:MAG: leucine-rich repeat protein [Clostridia bacterium]|nr:leucine-rich repeat protein [Clostridia bacterium]
MKKIFRISALVLLCLLLAVSAVSCGSRASSAASASGECGEGLTWSYDSSTQILSISGNGTMKDYTKSSDVPWSAARTSVKSISVSAGVLSIGDFAFYGFSALESVNLPDSLKTVGKTSFAFCTSLKNITLPSSVETIKASAFEGCSSLVAAFVPASVSTLEERVFAFCYSVTDAAVLADVNIPENAFLNCRSMQKLLLRSTMTADKVAATAFSGCSVGFDSASFTDSDEALAKVTVKYLDTEGNEVAPTVSKENIAYGDSYSIVSPAVDGYTADKLTVTGNAYGFEVEHTVTYTKNEVVEAPTTPEEEDKEITPATIVAVVILGIVLAGIAVGAFLLMRSEKKNAAKGQTVRKNTPDNKSKNKRK